MDRLLVLGVIVAAFLVMSFAILKVAGDVRDRADACLTIPAPESCR